MSASERTPLLSHSLPRSTTPLSRSPSRTSSRPPRSRSTSFPSTPTPPAAQTPRPGRPVPAPRRGSGLHVTFATPAEQSDGAAESVGERTPLRPVLERHRPLRETISRARLVLVLAGIWSSNFVFAFQTTAIPTLAPTIASGMAHAELASYLGSAFSLGNTAGIPVYGVLIETLGRRFAMLTACALFGVGTLACALAPDMYALIAARAFTGLGAGGLLTVSAVICTDLVHLHERGFYQGIMMTIFGLGSMLGGPLSGWLTDHYAWQLSFWVQLPILAWCAGVVGLALPDPPVPPTHRSVWAGLRALDWAGIFLLLGAVCALMLGLSLHTSYLRPWTDVAVWGLILASAVGIVAFFVVKARAKRPIVPPAMFANRQLVAIWLAGTSLLVASQAFLFHVPMYFTILTDSSAAQAGLVVSVCSGIGLSSGSLLSGYHIRRGGRYTLLGVFALIPSIAACLIAVQWTPAWPQWAYYATVLPSNVGYAIFLNVTLIALITSVDSATMPKATALLYTVRSLGATLGVSLGGSIQVGALVTALRQRFSDAPHGARIIDAILHSKAAIGKLPPPQKKLALEAVAISLSTTWAAAGGVAVCTLLFALFIKENAIPPKDKRVDARREGRGERGEACEA